MVIQVWDRIRAGRAPAVRGGVWAMKLVFPDVCAGCGVSGTWMCSYCALDTRRIDLATCCARCGFPAEFRSEGCAHCAGWVDSQLNVRCAYEFVGPVRKMVHLLKYSGQFARAEWCAAEMTFLLAETGWDIDVVIPVPLSDKRRRRRGFNQAEEIARRLRDSSGDPLRVLRGVRRARHTAPQVGLTQHERMMNVANAFEPVDDLDGLRVLLVDDVVTTGSTLQECSVACRAAGASSVRAIALARDV